MTVVRNYLREMRIHHYIKNLLILVPLICSGNLLNFEKLQNGICGSLAFCLVSSAIYFINDIKDIEKDKLHPTKRFRPIASGNIQIHSAIIFTIFLLILALMSNYICFTLFSSLLLLLYFIINIGYSFGLKNIPLLDICILVSGFLIRILYGAIVTDIQISHWLYLVVISVAFYLGLGKRRNELKYKGEYNTREVIQKYPFDFLDNNMYVFMSLIFVFYALWTVDKTTIVSYHGNELFWTIPIVIIIFLKYSLNIEKVSDGDPVEVLIHDKVLILLCILYCLLMVMLLYVV